MTVEGAFGLVEKAYRGGRLANGYLIAGGVRGMAGELAEKILGLLFGERDLRAHPDVHRLEAEKKSRVISVDAIRTRLIEPMGSTSFEGGWKAGVLCGADRLNESSANAFLKMLEEPPPRTVFLLLTDQPEQLLPTIVSRCQRIDLEDAGSRRLAEPHRGALMAILASERLAGFAEKAAAAARMEGILAALRAKAEEEVRAERAEEAAGPGEKAEKDALEARVEARYKDYRRDFLQTLMGWFRDLLAMAAAPASRAGGEDGEGGPPLLNAERRGLIESRAARLTLRQAMRNVRAVEAFAEAVDARSVKEGAALALMADRLNFGAVGR